MKLHTGDTVLIITGKDKGKTGQILRVLTDKRHVVVQGLNLRTRHVKKTPQSAGQKIRFEASLDVSKVMLLDPKTGKPTRVGYQIDPKTGKKVRIAKVSGAPIVGTAKAKAPKKAKAGETAEKTEKKAEESTGKMPTKRSFWNSKAKASDDAAPLEGDATAGAHAAHENEVKHTPIIRRSGRGS